MGLGLAITPSSSSAASVIIRSAGAGDGHSATPSIHGSNGFNTLLAMRVIFAKEPIMYSEERDSLDDGLISDETADADAGGNEDGVLTIKARSLRRTSSWNDSIAGSTGRRIPPRNGSKNKKSNEKKGGWLEWPFNAANASTGFGGTPYVSIIGRESRIGREDWPGLMIVLFVCWLVLLWDLIRD